MSRTRRRHPISRPSCASACSAATCSAAFLLRPSPAPTRSESTIAATSKVRRCGGPGCGDHLVAYARPAPGQQLLQGGLEVDPGLRRRARSAARRPRPPRPRCARSRRRGSRRRSAPRSPPAAAARRRAGPRPGSPPSTSSGSFARSISGTPSARPTSAQETPLTAWLWILVRPPAATSGKRSKRSAATASAEHAVAEEGEALEGVDPALGPGGVGQRLRGAARRAARRSAPRARRPPARRPRPRLRPGRARGRSRPRRRRS